MTLLTAGRVFADEYQFYVLDSQADPFRGVPLWNKLRSRRGYCQGRSVFYIGTCAHLNDHWVEVFLSDEPPRLEECERALALNIVVPSGRVFIMGPTAADPELAFDLPPGPYTAWVLAYSIGVDQMSLGEQRELSASELAARTDLEHYHIVFVPGGTNNEGVVKGDEYLRSG
jgi:hypothetical protein